MAPDERGQRSGEKEFEETLARHLRRQAQDGGAMACPDAEMLAAFQERALAPGESNSCREHIAGCARCREIVAALEKTAGLPAAAPEKRKRIVYWGWLAPAGALAAVLLLWVAVREKRPAVDRSAVAREVDRSVVARGVVAAPQPAIVAENRSAPSPGGAGVRNEAKPAAKQALPQKKEERSYGYVASVPASRVPEADKKVGRSAVTGEVDRSAVTGGAASGTVTGGEMRLGAPTDALRDKAAAPAEGRQSENSLEKSRAMKPAPAPARAQAAEPEAPQIAAPAAPPAGADTSSHVTAERSTAQKQKSAAAGMAAPAPGVLAESDSGFRRKDSLPLADAVGGSKRIIAAPGGQVQWSVGPGGAILRSTDRGKSWVKQASGVSVELLAGAAASASACWVVGRQGTVLLTTDGEHWTKLAPPTTADLTGVSARDARTVAVWGAAGGWRYVTADAGRTWAMVPVD